MTSSGAGSVKRPYYAFCRIAAVFLGLFGAGAAANAGSVEGVILGIGLAFIIYLLAEIARHTWRPPPVP